MHKLFYGYGDDNSMAKVAFDLLKRTGKTITCLLYTSTCIGEKIGKGADMSQIIELPEVLANQIAAGEVLSLIHIS